MDGSHGIDAEHADARAEFAPEAETLKGDVRDFLLSRIRTLQKPWQQMSEAEQRDLVNATEIAAGDVVRRSVRAVNSFEFPHAVVELGEVKIGGTKGIEAKIMCANIEHNRTVLGEHVGQHIMVLMCDSDAFMGARSDVEIDADQPELPVDQDA